MRLELDLAALESASARGTLPTNPFGSGTLVLEIGIADLGAAVDIQLPPADEVGEAGGASDRGPGGSVAGRTGTTR
jgi:hypothetical protein